MHNYSQHDDGIDASLYWRNMYVARELQSGTALPPRKSLR